MADKTFLSWPFFDDAHRKLAANVGEWAERHLSPADRSSDVYESSKKLVARLGKAGWLKFAVPAKDSHRATLDVRSLCIIRETLARHSSLADFAFGMQGLGSGPISLYGTPALQKKYLPSVASGSAIAAFAMSEADAGSDVAATATTARKDGSHYVVEGDKTWISNAGIADFYVVFARTGDEPGTKGLAAFVVDADTKGCEVTEQIDVISPHPLGSLKFVNCKVPETQMIGGPGEGFKIAMGTLDVFRSTVGAAALGFARRALDEATARAKERVVFGRPLADFQMTQQKIADMAVEVDASALLVYRAAWTKDKGAERVTREAAMAKMYATEAAQRVVDHAVQILGGLGVVSGNPVEQLYRDIRPLRIYEGTTEIQKIVVARETLREKR
ncbi:MAG: acyl-CoA dehydrogenase family protein [Candidatus Krumholzibacteria bacterium]